MAVTALSLIIFVTLVPNLTRAQKAEHESMFDVILSLKTEWTMKFEEQDRKIAQQQIEITRLNRKCTELERQTETRRIKERQTPERVAFQLLLSQDQDHIGLGQRIKFDQVLLNEGNGYNPTLDAFVAPSKGLYLFAYSIGKWRAGQAFVRIVKNESPINSVVVDVPSKHADHQGSNVAVVELEVDDVVFLEEFYQDDAEIYGGEHRWTSFSGVRLL